MGFPTPPLSDVHKELLDKCRKSVYECVQMVYMAAVQFVQSANEQNATSEEAFANAVRQIHEPFTSSDEDFNFRVGNLKAYTDSLFDT
jgi:hypothetical protein